MKARLDSVLAALHSVTWARGWRYEGVLPVGIMLMIIQTKSTLTFSRTTFKCFEHSLLKQQDQRLQKENNHLNHLINLGAALTGLKVWWIEDLPWDISNKRGPIKQIV